MTQRIDLVFRGQLQPGFDPEEAKHRLAALLKLKSEQAEVLFSGRRVVLRRGLVAADAERYMGYLSQTVGIRVIGEPQVSGRAAVDPAQHPVPVPPMTKEDLAERVVCPKCGTTQPPRNLCSECAVDMRRFRKVRGVAVAEARATRLSQATSCDAVAQGGRRRLGYGLAGLVVVLVLAAGMRDPATRTVHPAPVAVDNSAEIAEPIRAVEIYTTHSCTTCAAAKAYMRKNNIAFTEYDVEGDMTRRNEFYERGGKGVPLIFVRGRPMHGFDPDQFERLRADAG